MPDGLDELRPGADWWPDDAMTLALRAAAPKPRPINPEPPDWAIAYVEDLGRAYAQKEKERHARH